MDLGPTKKKKKKMLLLWSCFCQCYALISTKSFWFGRMKYSGGSRISRRGHGLPRRSRYENFVCQNERIWTLRGGRAPGICQCRSANEVVWPQKPQQVLTPYILVVQVIITLTTYFKYEHLDDSTLGILKCLNALNISLQEKYISWEQ